MSATTVAPEPTLAEPVLWNEDPQRQKWWKRILATSPPENPHNEEFQP